MNSNQTNSELYAPGDRRAHYENVRLVLWRVLVANLGVTIVKLVLGFVTGALAVIADGFHSLVDSSSNLIGLAAVRLAGLPADEKHPYGYRRYETIGALAIGGLLLAAAYEIGSRIIARILHGSQPEITLITLLLVILTFPVNVLIFTLERRAGRRLNSEILLADAAHTRTDLFVTLSVILSLIGVWFGWRWLDVLVAAGVIVLIVKAAFEILSESSGWLTDAVVVDSAQVDQVAKSVTGVQSVHNVRSRGTPDAAFVDLHVKVNPAMSTGQAHAIASEVEHQLKTRIPNVVEALVHIEPAYSATFNIWDRMNGELREVADRMGLGFHDLHIYAGEGQSHTIELHLEMKGDISIKEAHDLAEEFERRVQLHSSDFIQVITHLEPIPEQVLGPSPAVDRELEAAIHRVLVDRVGTENLLELKTYQFSSHVSIAARLCFPSDLKLAVAHKKAEAIEQDLLTRFPNLHRVVVHVEPAPEDAMT